MNPAFDSFPALDALSGIRAAFLTRVPGIDVASDRDTALARLRPLHEAAGARLGFAPPVLAEQVHGSEVAVVSLPTDGVIAGVDGLATNAAGLTLGIYVADCAAIFFVDRRRRAIALAHSGRKGTERNILRQVVATMRRTFSTDPADLLAVVSPCIRPPHYETDFAATISAQARSEGIGDFHDAGICTADAIARYYSYRREFGRTGRMLALLSITAPAR